MYHKKIGFLTACFFTGLVCLPLDFVNQTKVLAADQVVRTAQNKSAQYNVYMRRGYELTRRRNYRQAEEYFQKALELRPGDRYATIAITNVTAYIKRRRVMVFIPNKPGRRISGATRGDSIITLLPTNEEVQLTMSEHPKFWFYINPKYLEKIKELKFVLREGNSQKTKPVYETTLTRFAQAGIVSIGLPVDQPSLKVDKKYTWTFTIIYPDDFGVPEEQLQGQIRRVKNENLANQIREITQTLDQAEMYGRGGFWENALSILAELRCHRPDDTQVQKDWEDLLYSVERERFANQPILSCGISQK